MTDVTLNGYLVNLGKEISLVDVLMNARVIFVKLEVSILYLPLPIIQQAFYLLHVDDPIYLSRCQLTQPVLPAIQDYFLVHPTFLPIVGDVFLLQFLLKGAFSVLKIRCIDVYLICWDLSGLR
jgi:hypothetical protein